MPDDSMESVRVRLPLVAPFRREMPRRAVAGRGGINILCRDKYSARRLESADVSLSVLRWYALSQYDIVNKL